MTEKIEKLSISDLTSWFTRISEYIFVVIEFSSLKHFCVLITIFVHLVSYKKEFLFHYYFLWWYHGTFECASVYLLSFLHASTNDIITKCRLISLSILIYNNEFMNN